MTTKRKAFERWFKRTGPWPVIPKGYNLEGFLHTGFLAGWTACARAMRHELLDDRQSIIKGMEAMADESAILTRKAKKGRKR